METLRTRREPTLSGAVDAGDVGDLATPEPVTEIAPTEPEPEAREPEPPLDDAKVVTIRLMARQRNGFPGEKLVLTMRELGLRHGEFGIFHRPADTSDLPNEFSIASLVEPGSFDLTKIRSNSYPGVSIFMMLPANRDGVEIFDDMMQISRSLAKQLDGELVDEQGSSLSVQRERFLREEIIQFEHQGVS